MFGSTVLEIAIGIIFVYLLASLLVSAVTELLASWLGWRSDTLLRGIQHLLNSPGAEDWAKKLYAHPLIAGLSPPSAKQGGFRLAPAAKGPSYVPSRTFAVALLDLVRKADTSVAGIRKELQDLLDKVPGSASSVAEIKNGIVALADTISDSAPVAGRLKADLRTLVENIPQFDRSLEELKKEVHALIENVPDFGSTVQPALKRDLQNLLSRPMPAGYSTGSLKSDIQVLLSTAPKTRTSAQLIRNLQDLTSKVLDRAQAAAIARDSIQTFISKMPDRYCKDAIALVPGAKLRATLNLLLEESQDNLENLKESIETWFNNSMDRVSGWYKRKTQVAQLVLSIVVTLSVNLDTILVVKSLSRNPALRESLAAQAKRFVEEPSVPIPTAPPPPAPPVPPANAASLLVSPDNVVGGDAVKGVVTLSTSAPVGGTVITLSSADPNVATTEPEKITIGPGSATGEFQVRTKVVYSSRRVTVSAAPIGGVAMLTVNARPEDNYRQIQAQLGRLDLPLGWIAARNDTVESGTVPPENTDFRQWPGWSWPPGGFERWRKDWSATVRHHILGWILTAVAVSLGAPFWFDLLNKVVAIRSAGRAPEERPKPPKEVPKPAEPGQQAT